MSFLPQDDAERNQIRLADYMVRYFPKAQVSKAQHSYLSNLKHNDAEGMKWASEKSVGDGNQIMRHLLEGLVAADAGDVDEAEYHFTAMAWRADELLERFLTRMEPFNKNKPSAEA